jgi:aminoacyl tRNA synthase complex-interacting multifunctional protein 1
MHRTCLRLAAAPLPRRLFACSRRIAPPKTFHSPNSPPTPSAPSLRPLSSLSTDRLRPVHQPIRFQSTSTSRYPATAATMPEQPPLPNTVLALLARSHPSVTATESSSPTELNATLFPTSKYTPADNTALTEWLAKLSSLDTAALNTHLSTRTTILGAKPSLADVAIYAVLAPQVATWTPEQRTGEKGSHHIVRFIDFVQNSPLYGLKLDDASGDVAKAGVEAKVAINTSEVLVPIKPIDPKAEKERKKKEAAAAAGKTADGAKGIVAQAKEKLAEAGAAIEGAAKGEKKKKEKQPKQPKQPAAPAKDTTPSPTMIDLRVGHILKAEQHPSADKLYVSTIAMGDPEGTENTSKFPHPDGSGEVVVRTVCSGLAGLIPLEEMQNRLVVVVANLKPVNMRSIKSCAMVLAASPRDDESHAGPVELVSPPAGSKAGDRVYFDTWQGEPEKQLNPKKKVFETVSPGFTTTDSFVVAFEKSRVPEVQGLEGKADLALLKTDKGECKVQTLKDAAVR